MKKDLEIVFTAVMISLLFTLSVIGVGILVLGCNFQPPTIPIGGQICNNTQCRSDQVCGFKAVDTYAVCLPIDRLDTTPQPHGLSTSNDNLNQFWNGDE